MNRPVSNRRGSHRKRPQGWVKLEARHQLGIGPDIAHLVWDISQTGVCLVVKSPVKPGDELEVRICSYSQHQHITTKGTVVWVDPLDDSQFTVGLRFHQTLSYGQVSQLTL